MTGGDVLKIAILSNELTNLMESRHVHIWNQQLCILNTGPGSEMKYFYNGC